MTQIRLQRLIASAGIAARRKAEEMILAGRVTVNGVVVRELGTKVDPVAANVQVDGNPVAAQEHFYVLFNKPKACITAVTDDRGRMTVMDYLPNLPVQVAPVGRLDYYSEGVLLLTNDGELAAKLLAPGSHVPKTYHVKVNGVLRPTDLRRLSEGVTLDDGTVTAPAEVAMLAGDSKHPWLAFTLYEGKSRQIHRMLEALGHRVTKLQRVAFANLTFHGLRIGDARELTQAELNDLRAIVGLDRRAVARGRWSALREDTDRQRGLRQQQIDLAEAARAALEDVGPRPPGRAAAPPVGDDGDDEAVFERQLAARSRGGRDAAAARPAVARPAVARPALAGRPAAARPALAGRPATGRPATGRPSPGRSFGGDRPGAGDRGSAAGGRPSGTGRPSTGRSFGGDRPAFGDRRPAPGGGRPSTGRSFGGDRPAFGDRRPASGDRRPASGDRRPPPGDRPAFGDRRPGPGDRRPPPGDRPAFGDRRPAPGDRRPASGDRPAFGDRRPASGDRRPASGDRRPASGDRRPPPADRRAAPSDRRPAGPARGAARPGATRPYAGPGRPTGPARPSGPARSSGPGRPAGPARPSGPARSSGPARPSGPARGAARPGAGRPPGRPAPRGKGPTRR